MFNVYPADKDLFSGRAVSTIVFCRALERRGISYNRKGNKVLIENGAWFNCGHVSLSDESAAPRCRNKSWTKRYLQKASIQVLHWHVLTADDPAPLEAASAIGYPVVLKPLDDQSGRGVYPNIKYEKELSRLWECKERHSGRSRWMIERHFEGVDHRFLVVDGQVIAALRREPPRLVGDGSATVRELLDRFNAVRRRSNNPVHKVLGDLTHLQAQGLSEESVLHEGRQVEIVPTSNVSAGGLAVDITDEAPAAWKDLAVRAVAAIPGLWIGGVDILIDPRDAAAAVIEVNHNPMISMHHFPWTGAPRDVADVIAGKLAAGGCTLLSEAAQQR